MCVCVCVCKVLGDDRKYKILKQILGAKSGNTKNGKMRNENEMGNKKLEWEQERSNERTRNEKRVFRSLSYTTPLHTKMCTTQQHQTVEQWNQWHIAGKLAISEEIK